MAKDGQSLIPVIFRFIIFLMVASTVIAGLAYAGDTQSFRIRKHQSIKQDFTAEDVSREIRFGQKVAARLLGMEKLHKNPALNRYVSLIGASLALQAPRNELDYYFAVLDSDHINAYSTPGGYVFITRGALAAAHDESEVAAILAHEVAHITERHVVKDLNIGAGDTSNFSGFARFLGASGNTTQVALQQAVDKAISIIHEQGYKLRDEFQADRIAILLLAQTGYDPLALSRYLTRVEQHSGSGDRQSRTHPAPQERFTRMADLIKLENLGDLNFARAAARFNTHVKTRLDAQ